MLICIMVLAATAAGGWYLRKREYDIPDKIIKIMLCLQCLGIVLCVYDGITGNHTGAVTYNDVGEGTSSEQWLVSGDGFTEELEVEIPEKKLTREQADALAAEAVTLQFLPAS